MAFLVLALLLLCCAHLWAYNADREMLHGAGRGDISAVKEASVRGAHPQARNNNGVTALIAAANNGHLAVVQYFVEELGRPVDDVSNNKRSALMWAAHWGHLEVVKYLLRHGARLTYVDSYGNTALMLAALNGQYAVVAELLDAGSPVNVKNSYGGTALSMARARGDDELAALLEPYFLYDICGSDDNMFLIVGCQTYASVVNGIIHFVHTVRELTGLLPVKTEEL